MMIPVPDELAKSLAVPLKVPLMVLKCACGLLLYRQTKAGHPPSFASISCTKCKRVTLARRT